MLTTLQSQFPSRLLHLLFLHIVCGTNSEQVL